jgi:hypothetical protein
MVRFDTYNASAHLVRQIEASQVAVVEHDGGDNLMIRLHSGERISVYLIETIIPPYEIRMTLTENTRDAVHTLFILWGDMFLPAHDDVFDPDPWMRALITLYDHTIYAFDVYGKDIRIFPVYFEPRGHRFHIRYEPDIDVTRLGCDTIHLPYHREIGGEWRIADFAHERVRRARPTVAKPPRTAWDVLGVAHHADAKTIKRAFRRLARLHHPDISAEPDATRRMQAINQAYAALIDGDGRARFPAEGDDSA